MEDCIFCKIASSIVSSNVVYQDKEVFAFLDNNPIEKGHILVIPKKHYQDIFDIPDETVCHVYAVVKKITNSISKNFDVKDFNILQNNGSKAGQTVFHYHVHIIPRYREFKLCLGKGEMRRDEDIRDGQKDYCSEEIAELIRKEI